MAIIIVWLIFLFSPLIVSTFIPFEDCGSEFHVESIQISGCSKYPCKFKIGSTVNVTINLLVQGGVTFNIAELEQKVNFVISSIVLEAQVSPDLCTAVKTNQKESCEIQSGERIEYRASVNVINLPPLRATLWWTIKNQEEKTILCYKMTVVLI